jgi:cytochrome b561
VVVAEASSGLAAVVAFAIKSLHRSSVALCLGDFFVARAATSAVDAETAGVTMLHRSLSVTILALIALLFALRLLARASGMAVAPTFRGRMSVVILDLLLAAQPLTSLISSMLHGSRIVVFGNLEFPSLLSQNEPLARQILATRSWFAAVFLAVICVQGCVWSLDRFARPRTEHKDEGGARTR